MSSHKAKKDGQEDRSGIWNGPDVDSPTKPTAAGASPHQTKTGGLHHDRENDREQDQEAPGH